MQKKKNPKNLNLMIKFEIGQLKHSAEFSHYFMKMLRNITFFRTSVQS